MTIVIRFPDPENDECFVAARTYAAQGLRVFPCHTLLPNGRCTCREPSCGSNTAKHPRLAFTYLATTDIERLRKSWRQWSRSNVGICTGYDVVVIDVDNKPTGSGTGVVNFDKLAAMHGIPKTVAVETPSGGRHYYFTSPHVIHNYQHGARIAPGVDVRGWNGYVIAPPSMHLCGRRYQWVGGCSPGETAIAPLPEWLELRLLDSTHISNTIATHPKYGHSSRAESIPTRGDILPGSRHAALVRIAASLRNRGLDAREIFAALDTVNTLRCRPPKSRAEVQDLAAYYATRSMGAYDVHTVPRALRGDQRFVELSLLAQHMARISMNSEEIAATVFTASARRCEPPLDLGALAEIADIAVRAFGEVV